MVFRKNHLVAFEAECEFNYRGKLSVAGNGSLRVFCRDIDAPQDHADGEAYGSGEELPKFDSTVHSLKQSARRIVF